MICASHIGAFFDLDGTLLRPPSLEWRFASYLLAHGEISGSALLRWLFSSAKALTHHGHRAVASDKTYLAGLRETLASEWANSPSGRSLELLEDGMAQIAWHRGEGHKIVLVSGTLAPLARAVAYRFPGEIDVIATELEAIRGRWSGRLIAEHMTGEAKCRALVEFAARHALRLDLSYAYGDRVSDLPMLESVGHPFAVNPGSRFGRIAHLRGWPICDWRILSAQSVNVAAPRLSLKEAE